MLFEIKHKITGSVLFRLETESIKLCVEAAIKSGAYLDGANLDGANLDGAYLYGANLEGAYLGGDIKISKIPIQISSTTYHIIIFDTHMKIGCKFYSLSEWWAFDDRAIAEMDGKRALEFWRKWKGPLQSICEAEVRL